MAALPASYLIIFALYTLSLCTADNDVFLSIDCGSSDSYTDKNLIKWSGDDDFVQNGESKKVQLSNSLSHVMDTLRVFTTRNLNCYRINSIRLGRVLVRASFYYGNYDGKSTPPTFQLMLNGNPWSTVETSSSEYVSHEAIYVMKRDSISVCVAQTKDGQFPFMSALEVRGLEKGMYSYINDTNPLFLMTRLAYGANATIRYPDDPYDRFWTPLSGGKGLTTLSNNITFGSFSGIADLPPPAVLRNAITPSSSNSSILLFLPFPQAVIPVYINFYFSEVARLGPNETRSFSIFKDDLSFSRPIQPFRGNYTEMYVSNLLVSSNTSFSINPNNDTTLPPLINALELFLVGPELVDGTDMKDVSSLASLQDEFDELQGWSGDPCLPAQYSWTWINCSGGSSPRVTALFLGSFGLSGMLPDISSMDALETIDFHNNSLNGPIPDYLGKIPRLKNLNLADNNFNGSIPTSLSRKSGLNLDVTGNPNLCASGNGTCSPSNIIDSSKNSSGAEKQYKILVAMLTLSISYFVI